jgi:hypothetical protein
MAISDEQGRFILTGLDPDADATLTAEHRKRALRESIRVRVDIPGQLDRLVQVNLPLQRSGSLVGRVLLDGKPAIGVAVLVTESRRRAVRGVTPLAGLRTRTDEEGKYEINLLNDRQEVSVTAEMPGNPYREPTAMVAVCKVGVTTEMPTLYYMARDKTLKGTVVDADGNPLSGVVVSVTDTRSNASLGGTRAPTGNDGKFRIDGLPNVRLRLKAKQTKPTKGWTAMATEATPSDGEVQVIFVDVESFPQRMKVGPNVKLN